jgi:protein TBF1
LAKGTYQESIDIVTNPQSDPGQAYETLKSLFDQTKKLYSLQDAFLSSDELHLVEHDHRAAIRKANLATFVSSIFGSQDVGFYHLNEHFLDTFVPDGARLLKSQGGLYLELKTQAYISSLAQGIRSKTEILEDLFPEDMEAQLLLRRPGARQPTPSELDFLNRAKSRREHLLNETDDDNEQSQAALMKKYDWLDFLKDVSNYVSKNYHVIVAQPVSFLSFA